MGDCFEGLSANTPGPEQDVRKAQAAWASAIKSITKTYMDKGDYVAAAAKDTGELYCYGHNNVLFKPTEAKDVQIWPNANRARSYFVAAKAMSDGTSKDGGFAVNGGKGWFKVVVDNHQTDCHGKCCNRHGKLLHKRNGPVQNQCKGLSPKMMAASQPMVARAGTRLLLMTIR